MTSFIRFGWLLMLCLATVDQALGHTPVEFLEVIEVAPAQSIAHDVDLKTSLDEERITTSLRGPAFYSQAIGAMDRNRKKPVAYLNWFEITNRSQEPLRSLSILDLVRGGSNKNLNIGAAEYFLSPAQRITTGTPDPIPEGLDLYKAYRIIDGTPVGIDLSLTDAMGSPNVKVGRPLYVCLPTSEWHHDETFTPSHPKDCFVVYELEGSNYEGSFSTIDQFGLNELQAGTRRWVCVRAAFLRVNSK